MLGGCFGLKQKPVSRAASTSHGIQLEQTGDAKAPSNASQVIVESTLPVPSGSTVRESAAGLVEVVVAGPTEFKQVRTETKLETATPNAPPTISEQKDAEADFWTVLGLRAAVTIGSLLFLVGLIRGWDLVAIGGGALAIAGLVGIFIQKHPTIFVLVGIGAALCVAGPLIWKFKLKPLVDKQ